MSRFPKPPTSYPDLPDVKVRVTLKDDALILPLPPFRLSHNSMEMIEDCDHGFSEGNWKPATNQDGVMEYVELHFTQLNAETFRSVWEFCLHWYQNIPVPPPYEKLIYTDDLNDWNRDFMNKLSNQALIELLKAADYLDIWFLLRTCLQGLACRPDVVRSLSEGVVVQK